MNQLNTQQLMDMPTGELQAYTEALSSAQKADLLSWAEDMLMGNPAGTSDYKLELLLGNLYSLLAPEEGEDNTLTEYTEEGEQKYLQHLNNKMYKWANSMAQPGWYETPEGEKYWTKEDPWKTTTWQQEGETKTNLTHKYKYLPGPMPKENWNYYLWAASKPYAWSN